MGEQELIPPEPWRNQAKVPHQAMMISQISSSSKSSAPARWLTNRKARSMMREYVGGWGEGEHPGIFDGDMMEVGGPPFPPPFLPRSPPSLPPFIPSILMWWWILSRLPQKGTFRQPKRPFPFHSTLSNGQNLISPIGTSARIWKSLSKFNTIFSSMLSF